VGIFVLAQHWPLLGQHDDIVFYSPGPVFGIAMSAYCLRFRPRRSLLRGLGFIGICTGTEFVAILLVARFTLVATTHPNSAWMTYANPGFAGFTTGCFVAGTIGAFTVLLSALFLFSIPQELSRIVWIALRWSLIGGVSGILASAFGVYVSAHLWRLTGISAVNYPFDFVFLAWQSGMGLALGRVLQRPQGEPG
jgi:hypothetical protein